MGRRLKAQEEATARKVAAEFSSLKRKRQELEEVCCAGTGTMALLVSHPLNPTTGVPIPLRQASRKKTHAVVAEFEKQLRSLADAENKALAKRHAARSELLRQLCAMMDGQ